jgi:hypothetical protein
VVGGFSVLCLVVAGVWLILCVRAARSGVTVMTDKMKVRRILWSRSVPLGDVASFGLEANILHNSCWGSARLKDDERVRLPFCARSMVKDSPKNEPTLALLTQLDIAREASSKTPG